MPYLNKTQRVQAIVHFNEPQFKNVPYKYKVRWSLCGDL